MHYADDRFNERFEELNNHPDWSFYDHDFPSNAELLEARNRVFARHPQTRFLVLHVGNFAENLDNVSENLDRFPNMTVDIAARIGELGRQPRRSRRFFDHYQDITLLVNVPLGIVTLTSPVIALAGTLVMISVLETTVKIAAFR